MKGRRTMFGAVGALALILIAVACSQTQEQKPPRQQLTLAEAMLELASADPEQWEATEDALLALGPHALPGLKRMSELAGHIAAMHDKLLASADETKRVSTVMREATEAIEYFASKGAVRYLVLGLRSRDLGVQVRTADALGELDAGVKEKHRGFLVSALADFLTPSPSPITFAGSEGATIRRIMETILTDLLAELIGVDAEEQGTDEVVARAKEWLKAHGPEQDAPAGEAALGDEEPPKEE